MKHGSRLVLLLHGLIMVAVIAVTGYGQGPVRNQETAYSGPRVVSVFADQIPAVQPGQVIVQRHIYVACVDVAAKQPAWIAYHVSRRDWDTDLVLSRNFNTPRELRSICLEQSDYSGSGVDLGHLYGLQLVAANPYAAEVNQLCAIAAQPPSVNRGPWLAAENYVKQLSAAADVAVMAGQLWDKKRPPLPESDEPHRVASHWWMLISVDDEFEAWLIPHTAKRDDSLEEFVIEPAELRDRVASEWWSG